MKPNPDQPADAAVLRRRAEERLSETAEKSAVSDQRTVEDTARLVHELQVHQTELEMQNEELEKSRAHADALLAQFTDLYDFAPVGYLTLDRDGTIRQVNLNGARLLDVERSRLVNQRFGLFVAEGDRRTFSDFLEQVFASQIKEGCEVTLPREGSQALVVRIKGARSADGQECRAVLEDITERKQMVAALRASEERYRQIVETAHEGIWCLDADSRGSFVNQRMEEMLGYPAGEMLGRPLRDFLRPEDAADHALLFQTRQQGQPGHFERPYRHASGEWRWMSVSATPQVDAAGRFLGSFAMFTDITERQQAEATLRESEDRYRLLVEESPDAIGIYQEGKLVFINSTGAKLLGAKSKEELLGRKSEQVIHPDDLPNVMDRTRRRLAGETGMYPAEVRYVRLDGTIVPVEVAATAIIFGGKPAVQFIARDISERREAEEQLACLHEQNELILLSAAEGIIGLDLLGHHMFVNPAAASLLGYTIEEMIGRHSHSLWHHTKADGSPYAEEESPILATGREGTLHRASNEVFWHKAGHSFPVEYAARPIREKDGIVGTVVTFTDITERKRAEALLRLESAALEAAANAIIITDPTGRIEWANAAFTALTGYSLEEAVGQNPRLLKSGKQDREFYRNLWDTILAGKIWRGELINRRKDGELYQEDVTITPLHDERGEILHFIAVKQDITERKKLAEQYQQSQKMEAIGHLAGGVAHDFNNLLGVMLGNAQQMQLGLLSASHQESLQEILDAGERASNLTRQLLTFSRGGNHHARPVDLNEVVSGMNKMLRRIIGEDVVLETRLAPAGAPVQADPSELELVLMNLIVNARAAMPAGGKIVITIECFRREATATRPGEFVRLSVSDTGSGIAPEHLPRIFEPFFTTKDVGKGTGLGLATAHGIVAQHQGWIEVASAPGQGTTFHIYLPRRTDAQPASPVNRKLGPVRGGSETILVVEDEAALLWITCRTLRNLGYRVIEAGSGRTALELWPQHGAEVALVLTDVIMPEGVSGRDLAEQLSAQKPGLKVIYMSGYPGDVAGQGLVLREGENLLRKPFNPGGLAGIVRNCLDAKPET